MGPRSNFGSQAHLFSQNGQSQTNPYNTLRFAVKVLQIDPPESDDEHSSLDSKDPHSLENEKKFGSSKLQMTKIGENYKSPISKDLQGQETPANGFEDLVEMPLNEEPMPEQKSIAKQNGFTKQVELMRVSNDFNIGAQEMPKQPVAHDDPPFGIDTSKHSVSPIACKVSNISKVTTPEIGQDGWNEAAQGPHEAFKQLKLATNIVSKVENGIADVDAVHNNGMPSQQDEDSYSESEDVQFPQDVLFTNVNSSKHVFIGQANNFEELSVTHHNNQIMRDGDEKYVKMKQELQDSNVYFFNHLRREFDNEEREFRLSEPKKEEQDQTSFPCISAFIEKQGSIQKTNEAAKSSSFYNKHSRMPSFSQTETNRNADNPRILKNEKRDSNILSIPILTNISANRLNERRDDSFFIEKAQDDTRLVRGSIAVDSADFGESRLLKTERKVLHQAEILKENVKVQNGNWLQQQIDMAKPNEVIYLESTTYKFSSLFMKAPVTLYGQPETILEVDGGSIFVDFRKLDNLEEADLEDEENIVNPTPFAAHESNLFSNQALKTHPLNRGTPLTIKKNRVARIQICEIRFNRTKASLQAIVTKQQQARPQTPAKHQRGRSPASRLRGLATVPNQENEPQFSHEISLGATQNNQNVGQPSLTMLQINTSNNMVGISNTNNNTLQHPIAGESQTQLGQAGAVSCFVIEQKSFIEVKDCFIKSIKDKKNFDQEMDLFFRCNKAGFGQSLGVSGNQTSPIANEKTATNDQITQEKHDFLEQMRRLDNEIQDYCFTMNLPDESTGHSNVAEYSGLVSLCSTTIQNFMFGIYCGADAILTSESSSFIALRAGGCAIKSYRPKLLKVMNGSIQKCEAHGIQVTLDEMPLQQAPFQKALNRSPREKADFGQASSVFALSKRNSTKQSSNNVVSLTEQVETESDAAHASLLQKLARKVYIENNRIVQVQGCPIMIEGPATDHYLQYFIKVKDNRISNCGTEAKLYSIPGATDKEKEEEIQLVKQAFAQIGGQPPACILLKNLHVYFLSCFRNTISKGSGSGITIFNVKGHKEDMTQVAKLPTTEQEAQTLFDLCVGDQQRVTVVDNYVIETAEGYGMIIDSSTCHLELNQLKKNALGGLMITSSNRRCNTQAVKATLNSPPQEAYDTARSFGGEAVQNSPVFFKEQLKEKQAHSIRKQSAVRISQIKRFCSINIDNSTAVNNLKYGIGVFSFYGTVTIKNTSCNENETDGLIFSRKINSPFVVGLNERLEDEAQYLDYADFTDLSSKLPQIGGNRSRSPTLFQATEKSLIEGNMTSYRQEEGQQERQDNSTLLERPFEKQVGTIYLSKCTAQQNRGDGIKSVDCAIESLGCTIQGNMSCAIRLCDQDRGAKLQIYLKARNNDSDIIGHVLGQNGTRFNPKLKVDSDLQLLLKDLIKVQLLQAYVEMIQMSQEEAVDLRTSTLQKSVEQKLISQVETQKIIIEQRDPRLLAPQKKGFFSLFKCCSSVKSSSNNSAKKPAQQQSRPGVQSQAEIKKMSLNSQADNVKRIKRQQ